MSADKPIHVRVAESRGWLLAKVGSDVCWYGRPTGAPGWDEDTSFRWNMPIPRYDLDLKENLQLQIEYGMTTQPILVREAGQVPKIIGWEAKAMSVDQWSSGETLLLAVCEAVLKAEGR